MTQSDVDIDFLNGLQLMIDSMAASHLEKADDPDIPGRFADAPDAKKRISHNGDEEHLPEDRRPLDTTIAGGGPIKYQRNIQNADEDEQEIEDNREVASTDWESTNGLPDADHWCPDVQAWHTSDHEPAKAPSVHVNVDSKEGDDRYQSENGEVEKAESVARQLKDGGHGIDSLPGYSKEYDQNTNLDRHEQENTEDSIAEPFLHRREVNEEDTEENENIDKATSAEKPIGQGGTLDEATAAWEKYAKENKLDPNKEYPVSPSGHHLVLPIKPDRGIKKSDEEFLDAVEQTHGKAIDILKLWASVDRVIPKTEVLVNDINILKSFNLDETTNVEDLVTGTLVHKMLVDRTSRPTADWWESSMLIAKSIEEVDEPGFFSAFLYYEPNQFEIGDFLNIEKAERSEYGKPQDQEDMPNNSGGSAIDGLGMSADELEKLDVQVTGPEDEDCDD